MAEQDWSKVELTQDLIEYLYDKYGDVEVTDEMLDDLYNFAMMKGFHHDEYLVSANGGIFPSLEEPLIFLSNILLRFHSNYKAIESINKVA
ncbi:hypothetical protein Tco_0591183 [Tanacetum coccineum]